jgi:hypothetical protein
MKTTIYSKNQIISTIISKQNDTDMLANTISDDMRKKIMNRVNEKLGEKIQILMSYSDADLIIEFKKQNQNSDLRVFAPGLYFITDEINKFSFQIL